MAKNKSEPEAPEGAVVNAPAEDPVGHNDVSEQPTAKVLEADETHKAAKAADASRVAELNAKIDAAKRMHTEYASMAKQMQGKADDAAKTLEELELQLEGATGVKRPSAHDQVSLLDCNQGENGYFAQAKRDREAAVEFQDAMREHLPGSLARRAGSAAAPRRTRRNIA